MKSRVSLFLIVSFLLSNFCGAQAVLKLANLTRASLGKTNSAGVAPSGYTLINHTAKALGTSGGTSTGITTTGATVEFVGVCFFNSIGSLTDSKGNTWTATTVSANAGNTRNCVIYYCVNPTTDAAQTFSTTANLSSIFVLAYSGNAATPFDQENQNFNDASATFTGGSVTPLQNNEIVISLMGYFADPSTAQPVTINSSFTKVDSVDWGGGTGLAGAIAWKQQSTATSENPTWALAGGTADGVAKNATFK